MILRELLRNKKTKHTVGRRSVFFGMGTHSHRIHLIGKLPKVDFVQDQLNLYPDAPCMECLLTFTINLGKMQANIPYMEHLG